jgi:hypothetical protein
LGYLVSQSAPLVRFYWQRAKREHRVTVARCPNLQPRESVLGFSIQARVPFSLGATLALDIKELHRAAVLAPSLPAGLCAAQDPSHGGPKPSLGGQNCKVYFESQNADAAMQKTTDACKIDLAPKVKYTLQAIAV